MISINFDRKLELFAVVMYYNRWLNSGSCLFL